MWSAVIVLVMACGGAESDGRDTPDDDAAALEDRLGAPTDDTAGETAGVEDTRGVGRASAGTRGTVVFVGTSLTAGLGVEPEDAYPARVAALIDSAGLPFDVVNAGSSGETSAGALRRIDWLLSQRPIDVLVLETGANDGLRALDVDSTRANIQAILTRVRVRQPDARLWLVQMEAPPNLGDRYTRRFREMFPSLARENGAGLIPFLLEGVAGVDSLNQGDGIHPNEEGHGILARTVWQAIGPGLRAEGAPLP